MRGPKEYGASLMFIYDDYGQGLRVTAREILPRLREAFA